MNPPTHQLYQQHRRPTKIQKSQHGLAYSESHRDAYSNNDNEDRCDWEQSMDQDMR